VPLDLNELHQLLVTIDQTSITELAIKSENFELTLRRAVSVSNQSVSGMETVTSSTSDTTGNEAVQSPIEHRAVELIVSPLVGVFYRSPSPNEKPFVEVGTYVSAGQTVCIIEAMKIMNEIESTGSGQVIEILVENGEPVDFAQPLMKIILEE